MSYNRILPHKLVKYDVFKVTVQGVSWIRGVRQVRLAKHQQRGGSAGKLAVSRPAPLLPIARSTVIEGLLIRAPGLCASQDRM